MTESAKTRYMYTAVAKYFEGKMLHQIAADLGLARITIARWLRKW
jgi:DNA-binding transcriptional regulator LsrR (DeoR family)